MNIRAKIFGSKLGAPPLENRKCDEAEPGDKLTRSNSRNLDRHRLSEEKVRVTRNGLSYEADLINVSGGGAMIAAKFEANEWDSLELHLGKNGTIECAVRWTRDGRIGLEFAHETRLDCPAHEQAILLREVLSRTYREAHFTNRASARSPQSSEPKDETGSDCRRAKRHPLIWSGNLEHDGTSTPVRVRNISATGAMIQCNSSLARGSDAVLQLGGGLALAASVGWAVGDQVGLQFHDEFEISRLSRSTPEVAPTRWVRPAYLDNDGSSDSPWDPRWERLSVGELKNELEGFLKR